MNIAVRTKEIARRLGKTAKGGLSERNQNKVVFVHVRPDANHHVGAWEAWNRLQSPTLRPPEFVRLHCRIAEIDQGLLLRPRYSRLHVFRRWLVREARARYPKLSSTQLGHLFNRDHTTILYLLGTTATAKRRGLV